VHAQLAPDDRATATILTASYGEAGAIDVLGTELGLPAAVSGHNNYHLWGPPGEHGPIIAVGSLADLLSKICPAVDRVDIIDNPWGVENEEFGHPILLCPNPTGQLADVWELARHYN